MKFESRGLTTLALALGLMPTPTFAQDPHGTGHAGPLHAEAEAIASVVDAYHVALATGQGDAALALLTEDAIVLEGGGVETKAQYADHHLPADMAFAQAVPRKRGDVHVSGRGEVAWAWSTSEAEGTYRDRDINSVAAELMVLVKTEDGWKISAIHWSSRSRQ